jgi:hypothetical protein
MIFSPFFYYCFTGFTSVCYGRWQLFVVAALVIYCAINLDKIKQMKGWYFDLSFFICLVFEIVLIILAIKYQGTMGTKNLISNTKVEDKLICAIIQPMILTVMYFILRHNFKKENFGKKLNWAVIAEIAFVGNMVVLGQGTCDYSTLYGGQNDVNSATKLIADINKNDKTYYRMFNTSADRDANNLGMVEGYRGVSTFHSMYNYSLNELGEWSRLTYTTSSKSWRPWSMGYHEKRWNLDTLLGIKYYIVNNNDSRINKNDSIVKIVDNKWTFNGANSSIKAFSPYDIENDTDYIISSISLKQHKGDHDIYTVEFSNDNASQDVKTYNVTIENDRLINVQVGSNGNWFFNELDIGVKAYKECLNSTTSSVITSFQKLDGSDVYHINFTNGNSCNSILNLGEDKNVPCGYKEIARDNYNVVYENENFINLGLSFDNLTSSEYVSSSDSYLGGNYAAKVIKNEMAYVRTAILDRKDIDEINSLYEGVFTSHIQSNDTIYTNSDINNELHVFNINNNNINVYLQNWNHSTGVALNYASPVKYPADGISQIYWNSYMDVDLSSLQVASEAKERGGAFVTVNGRMGENLMITLYGQDDNGNEIELNRDIHMKHNYDKSGDWKYERGFYVNQRVTRVVVRAYDTFKKDVKFAKPNITVQYYDSYVNNINKLKQYELKDVVCKTNEFDFKTDYDNTRLQVLTIPYDSGWKLTRIDENGNRENVKLYMAQGGFNSFVVESGNYSYELTYSTPGLSTGILGFGIGLSLFSALYIAFDLDFLQKKQIKKLLAID